jgi:predicted dehydrogenase
MEERDTLAAARGDERGSVDTAMVPIVHRRAGRTRMLEHGRPVVREKPLAVSSAEPDAWRLDAAQGGPSRAFADIGSHRCDSVGFVTGERRTPLCAQSFRTPAKLPAAVPRGRSRRAATPAGGARSARRTR